MKRVGAVVDFVEQDRNRRIQESAQLRTRVTLIKPHEQRVAHRCDVFATCLAGFQKMSMAYFVSGLKEVVIHKLKTHYGEASWETEVNEKLGLSVAHKRHNTTNIDIWDLGVISCLYHKFPWLANDRHLKPWKESVQTLKAARDECEAHLLDLTFASVGQFIRLADTVLQGLEVYHRDLVSGARDDLALLRLEFFNLCTQIASSQAFATMAQRLQVLQAELPKCYDRPCKACG